MPINPLQTPQPINVPNVDWSPLARIGEAVGDYRMRSEAPALIAKAFGAEDAAGGAPDKAAIAQRIADLSANPYTAKFGQALAAKYLDPNEYTYQKFGEDVYRLGKRGDYSKIGTAREGFTASPGQVRYGADNQPVAAVPPNLKLENPEDPTGVKRPVVFNPQSGATTAVPVGAPGVDVPPGVNGKTLAQQRAKDIAANDEDAIKSATAAAELKPYLDKMHASYAKLIKMDAIGPLVGNTVGRTIGSVFHTDAEAARQEYDTSLAAVRARITAAQNKGQGAVSNYERQLYSAQFPGLDATDPNSQLPFLKQIRDSTEQTIAAGKKVDTSKRPAVGGKLERPPVAEPPPKFGSVKISGDAVRMLQGDPTPQRREQFDQVFGIGAADRVLGRAKK